MSNWKEYTLSNFIDINPKVSLDKDINYSFVEMKDLSEKQKYVLPSQDRELKGGARFADGDTLFARITPCLENGKICQVKGLRHQIGFGSTEFLVFRGKSGISHTDFVYYLSRYDVVRKFAEQNMVGTSGRQRVSKEAFDNIALSLPDLETQCAIAEILSSLDDKIELNSKINQELEALAQALFKQWFIDFEFPDDNGKPYKSSGGKMVENELGEMPKGWSPGQLGSLAKIVNGFAFKSKDFQETGNNSIIKIKNVGGSIVDIENTQFVSDEVAANVNSKFKVRGGDILIAMTGAEVGKIGIVPKTEKTLLLNQRVGRFEPVIPQSSAFIHALFNVMNYTDAVRNLAMGSAQPNISSGGIEGIKCLIPAKRVIDDFGIAVNENLQLLIHNLAENEVLADLRDSILPKLIGGELELFQSSIKKNL